MTCPAGHTTRIRPGGRPPNGATAAHSVHHPAGTDHHSRPIPRPTPEQGPVGQRRNAEHLTGRPSNGPPRTPTEPRASPQPANPTKPTNASSTSDSTTDPPAGHTTPPKPPKPNPAPSPNNQHPPRTRPPPTTHSLDLDRATIRGPSRTRSCRPPEEHRPARPRTRWLR